MTGWAWILDWKGCARRRLWSNLKYSPHICLEIRGKARKISLKVSRCSGWDSNRAPPKNKSQAILREALTWFQKSHLHDLNDSRLLQLNYFSSDGPNERVSTSKLRDSHMAYTFLNQQTSMARYVRTIGNTVPCFQSTRTSLAQAISALLVQCSSEYTRSLYFWS
jgi:hypothetical protein